MSRKNPVCLFEKLNSGRVPVGLPTHGKTLPQIARILMASTLLSVAAYADTALVKLRQVPFTQVKIEDRFWGPRRDTNRVVSIPHNLKMLEEMGNVKNFELAAAGAHQGYSGPVFMDSDLYKGLEAASYSLATDPNPELDKQLDRIIEKIAAAQQTNGYLNTHFTVVAPDKRWTNLRDWHELYCAGHFFEAAVAHFQATGKRNMLDIAIKLADHIDAVFGSAPGKRMGYPGHPEIELALVKLSRVTGEDRYFNLARFFIENRGRHFFAEEHQTPLNQYDGSYWQDDVLIQDHKQIKGHAVRAAYLLSGAVDVASRTGDPAILKMVDRVWRNTTQKRMYLTGGIGPSADNEGFTEDYDLPNATAYQETCASVAMALWNDRLALLYGDAKYADLVELALYNGILAGVSLDGTHYFYVNPLESRGAHHRSGWFGCACCPPNVARTLSSLGNYAYAQSDAALYVNLFIQGSVQVELNHQKVNLKVTTDYPWDGKIKLVIESQNTNHFNLAIRIPGWCQEFKTVLNGTAVSQAPILGYLSLDRDWKSGDSVELNLAMPVQRVAANPMVKEDKGLLAIRRGPLVYCLEACDQTVSLDQMSIAADAAITPVERPDMPGRIIVLQGEAAIAPKQEWRGKLYQPAVLQKKVLFTAVPYYFWDNRQAGVMKVWMPTTPPISPVLGLESGAKVEVSFQNANSQPSGINDGVEPKSSNEQPAALCHWWPHNGTAEWVSYSWEKPLEISGARVYWFDDAERGNCRLPESWEIQYRDGDVWKPVESPAAYEVGHDRWCQTVFKTVKTTGLRLNVKMQAGFAAGAVEWKVLGPDDVD